MYKSENNISKDTSNNKVNFNLPIYYLYDKYKLEKNISDDLEIYNNKINIYYYLFNSKEKYSKLVMDMWGIYYTTNIDFLNDTKFLIKNFKRENDINNNINDINDINNIDNIITEIRNETGFNEKYKFINNNYFMFLNENPLFLQSLTFYNLVNPLFTLIFPILILIIPFFLIKIQKQNISFNQYCSVLKNIIIKHTVGKIFFEFNDVGWDRKFIMLFSFVMYIVNIYQNFISCYNFYLNYFKIKQYMNKIKNFITISIKNIDILNKYCKNSYQYFANKNMDIKNTLLNFNNSLSDINFKNTNIKDVSKIGNLLYCFYQLFYNKNYNLAIDYSLYLNGYIDNILNLQINLKNKKINFCNFTDKNTKFIDSYFAPLIETKYITNKYSLKNNLIISGPNASGKTTVLKSTLFNIIISQQLGLGFYRKCNLNPYRYIHSYLNIPDTSERDSLFQAEARRCKEILDLITSSNNNERHFCIFDELYSGTNPSEAIASAYSILINMSKYKNLNLMLTTHYNCLCSLLNDKKKFTNFKMQIINDENTYKLIHGINNINGGIKILKELNYSSDIIVDANNIIQKLNI